MTAIPNSNWRAMLQLDLQPRNGKTVVANCRRSGPITLQRALYPEGSRCHIYLLHPPGGVVGGDIIDLNVKLTKGAQALFTTPGASKFYYSNADFAHTYQRLVLNSKSSLEWLPQENIFFAGAQSKLDTDIHLNSDSMLAWWEVHCFGRPATQEEFTEGYVESTLAISVEGKRTLFEKLRVNPTNRTRASLLSNHPVCGTAVFSHANRPLLERMRDEVAPELATCLGLTQINQLVIARHLSHSTTKTRQLFTQLWSIWRTMCLNAEPCIPRIWYT